MPGDRATAPPPRARPSWRETLTDPAVVAVGLYGLMAILAAVAAYLAIFTQVLTYDDEGTLLLSLDAFTRGDVLYRDVYSPYGPFYYELFGGLFSLSGQAVTTEAGRSIVIMIWVATSLFYGIVVQRLTGYLALGLTAMGAAFSVLYVLASEPMHPQGLCVLLLALFTLLVAVGPSRRPGWAGAGCGALLAALLLTKINLGVFAIAAVVLAAVLTIEPLRRRRWLFWPVVAAYLAMPVAVMARDLSSDWVRDLMGLELLAMAALLVAAWPLRPAREDGDSGLGRWLLFAAGSFALACVAIFVAILLTGPTPADIYDGMITQAFRVRDVLVTPLVFPPATVDWGVGALAAAVLATVLRRTSAGSGPSLWPGLLRALAGLTILFVVAHIVPLAFNPAAGNPDTLPMLLAWVAAIPPAGVRETTYKRFLRVLLPALAIAQTLQVYPVAGSQIAIAALTFIPVAGLCLGDALTSLRAWSEAHGGTALQRFGIVAAVVTIALAAEFTLDSIVRPGASKAVAYRDSEPLPFDGAGAVRIPANEVATYAGLVELLRNHRCTTFIGYPNMDSLYLWSGIDAPPPQPPGAWINALDDEQQQRVVDAMRASPRPCAFRSDQRVEAWLHGNPPPDSPLVRYIFDDFRQVAGIADFQFLLPKAESRPR